MRAGRQQARLRGEHGLVERMGNVGVPAPAIVTLIHDGKGHAALVEAMQVVIGREGVGKRSGSDVAFAFALSALLCQCRSAFGNPLAASQSPLLHTPVLLS